MTTNIGDFFNKYRPKYLVSGFFRNYPLFRNGFIMMTIVGSGGGLAVGNFTKK
jgi:hypothetical protein